MDAQLILSVVSGVAVLLVLILYVKIHPFLSLLISSIVVGVFAGMPIQEVFENVKNGIGGTLGFVATIIGLGAIFGAVLEKSGGASELAKWLSRTIGQNNAPSAMMIAGFFVAIPVFFDVAFIILLPVALALNRALKKPLLLLVLPLLAGLAITHAFIPPTPGPVAVADIMGVGLGEVIIIGFIVGLPTAIISGPLLAKYINKHLIKNYDGISLGFDEVNPQPSRTARPLTVLIIIFLPIVLIVTNTICQNSDTVIKMLAPNIIFVIQLIGHPFAALIISNLIAWYVLGIRLGSTRTELLDVSMKSFYPAGSIILLTGAGGAFKQILVSTGAGEMIAALVGYELFTPVLFAFCVAALVRVIQGSATVAMITAAGITAPLLSILSVTDLQKAILVIAIASGATFMSHVNDSGFWLVSQYLKLDTRQTFKSWTFITVVIGLCGLMFSTILWFIV